jgi:hypothetical protein
MSKNAILNIADTGALESTAMMLTAAGYKCYRPGPVLLAKIRQASATPVFSVEDLHDDFGYDWPRVNDLADLGDMASCDLFVDVKAHVNYPHLVRRWPNLAGRVLWCCLNGGDPLKRKDGLPWADPPCPVLTNNQWYNCLNRCIGCGAMSDLEMEEPHKSSPASRYKDCQWPVEDVPWAGRAYACYPPYARLADRKRAGMDGPPVCLVHNVNGWGYGHLVETFRALGGKCYGVGCPDGMLPYPNAMEELSHAVCVVYLKVGDTVGYATVEALASEVPFVCTSFYISETRLGQLVEPDRTCCVFDPHSQAKAQLDLEAILRHLSNPDVNRRVGQAGRQRLLEVMWNADRDLAGFKGFLERNFK